jgi:hypothetical protein
MDFKKYGLQEQSLRSLKTGELNEELDRVYHVISDSSLDKLSVQDIRELQTYAEEIVEVKIDNARCAAETQQKLLNERAELAIVDRLIQEDFAHYLKEKTHTHNLHLMSYAEIYDQLARYKTAVNLEVTMRNQIYASIMEELRYRKRVDMGKEVPVKETSVPMQAPRPMPVVDPIWEKDSDKEEKKDEL